MGVSNGLNATHESIAAFSLNSIYCIVRTTWLPLCTITSANLSNRWINFSRSWSKRRFYFEFEIVTDASADAIQPRSIRRKHVDMGVKAFNIIKM